MKVDRRNPLHWLYLAAFLANALAALALRSLVHRRKPVRVLFYGHKLAGNLAPLLKAIVKDDVEIEASFLTMDPQYHRELVASGHPSLLAISPRSVQWMAHADAVICDHGVHCLYPLLRWSNLKFFDVWHGIPFKGFDANDFRTQQQFDEVWVASQKLAELYVNRFGFRADRVYATGYARTDQLVAETQSKADLRIRLGLPTEGPIVVFAPTWAQDEKGRSIFPFGATQNEFLSRLSQVASRCGATIILRTHLNTQFKLPGNLAGIMCLSSSDEPDTEAVLGASDALICDWSSIAFDYLLLERPALFLDVPAPFRKGFSLGPEYRFGNVVANLDELSDALQAALLDPKGWLDRHRQVISRVRAEIYGTCADGQATNRCIQRLRLHLWKWA